MVISRPASYVEGECIQIIGYQAIPFLIKRNGLPFGIYADFIRDLANKYSFCYNLSVITDVDMAIRDENGNYIGAMKKLYDKELDFSIEDRTLSAENSLDFDFSTYINIEGRSILLKYPRLESDILGIIKTFDSKVWFGVFLSFIIGTLALHFILKYQFLDFEKKNHSANFQNFGSAILNSVKMYLNQSFGLQFSSNSSKLICGTLLLFTLITTLSYKCNLKAMMILPKVHLPFQNIEGMLNQDKVKWFSVKGTRLQTHTAKMPEGSQGKRWADGIALQATSIDEIYRLLATGKYVLTISSRLCTSGVLESYLKNNKTCTNYKLDDEFMPAITAWHFKRNSPWLSLINHGIVSYRENGITLHEENLFYSQAEECKTIGKDIPLKPLALPNVYGLFAIYFAGILASTIVLFAEMLM